MYIAWIAGPYGTIFMPQAGFEPPPRQREDLTAHMLYLQATTAGYLWLNFINFLLVKLS